MQSGCSSFVVVCNVSVICSARVLCLDILPKDHLFPVAQLLLPGILFCGVEASAL